MSIEDHWKIIERSYFLSPEMTPLKKNEFLFRKQETRQTLRHMLLPLEGMLSAWHWATRESMDTWSAKMQGGSGARMWIPAVIMRVSTEKPPTLEMPQLWAGSVRAGRLTLDRSQLEQDCPGEQGVKESKAEERAVRFVPKLQASSVALGLWGFLVTDPATFCLEPSKVHFSAYSRDSIGHLGNRNC